MRLITSLATLALVSAWPIVAPAADPLQQLQTDDLQLVWFHPAEDYLAPHVARSFENSMAWQRRV